MGHTPEEAEIEVLDISTATYSQEKAWHLAVSFPDIVAGLKNKEHVSAPVEHAIYRVQSWTDEPVDLHEVQIAAFNSVTKEYRLMKGDDDTLSEKVRAKTLTDSREIMFKVAESLNS